MHNHTIPVLEARKYELEAIVEYIKHRSANREGILELLENYCTHTLTRINRELKEHPDYVERLVEVPEEVLTGLKEAKNGLGKPLSINLADDDEWLEQEEGNV